MNSWAEQQVNSYANLASSLQAGLAFDTDCVYLHAPGIAKRLCPAVFSKLDEDGLIPLSAVPVINEGALESNGHLLVPASSLRVFKQDYGRAQLGQLTHRQFAGHQVEP